MASLGACKACLLLATDASGTGAVIDADAFANASLLPLCLWFAVDGATVAQAVGLNARALLETRATGSLAWHTLQHAGTAVRGGVWGGGEEQLAAVDLSGQA